MHHQGQRDNQRCRPHIRLEIHGQSQSRRRHQGGRKNSGQTPSPGLNSQGRRRQKDSRKLGQLRRLQRKRSQAQPAARTINRYAGNMHQKQENHTGNPKQSRAKTHLPLILHSRHNKKYNNAHKQRQQVPFKKEVAVFHFLPGRYKAGAEYVQRPQGKEQQQNYQQRLIMITPKASHYIHAQPPSKKPKILFLL